MSTCEDKFFSYVINCFQLQDTIQKMLSRRLTDPKSGVRRAAILALESILRIEDVVSVDEVSSFASTSFIMCTIQFFLCNCLFKWDCHKNVMATFIHLFVVWIDFVFVIDWLLYTRLQHYLVAVGTRHFLLENKHWTVVFL